MPSAVPNYLTTDSQGGAHAIFPGGVSMLAATDATPVTERSVSWTRESDGALVAQVRGWEGSNQSTALLSAGVDTDTLSEVDIVASNGPFPSPFNRAAITILANAANKSRIQAQSQYIGGPAIQIRNILNGDGGSDFASVLGGVSGIVSSGINFWAGYVFNIPYPALNGLLVIAQGSGYVAAAATGIDYRLLIDGTQIAGSGMLINNPGNHTALPLLVGKTGALAAGNHTIQFSNPISALAVDGNDFCGAGWVG